MKKFFKKNLIIKLILITFLIYVAVVLFNQQQTLSSYHAQKEYYNEKIEEAKKYNQTLMATKDHLDSKEYIEAISREKLDMYSKNERVYININQ